jgi:hypothetical protein
MMNAYPAGTIGGSADSGPPASLNDVPKAKQKIVSTTCAIESSKLSHLLVWSYVRKVISDNLYVFCSGKVSTAMPNGPMGFSEKAIQSVARSAGN